MPRMSIKKLASEKALQNYIVQMCKEYDILCYKFASPSKRGVPDLLLFNRYGIGGFIEVKNPLGTGRLSPLQKHELDILTAQRVYTYVIKDAETATIISASMM